MEIWKALFEILIFPGLFFSVVMGILLAGLSAKLTARMQNRVGPPVLQPLYDFAKCCGKETIIPAKADKFLFKAMPVIGFCILISASVLIPFAGFGGFAKVSDIVVILYLLTFVSVCGIIGAAVSGSPYAGVGLSREMVSMISYELPFVLVLLAVAKHAGDVLGTGMTFSLLEIGKAQAQAGSFIAYPALIPAAVAMLFVIPCEIGLPPFDAAEAETEISEGMLAEYSGKPLGMYKLTHTVKTYVMSALFLALFTAGIRTGSAVLDFVIALVLLLAVMFLSMALPRAISARFKIEQIFRFYWTFVSLLALVSLILVWVL